MTTTHTPVRTYGNFRRPQTAGIMGLGTLGTLMIFAGAFIGMVIMLLGGQNGIWYAAGWVLFLGLVLLAMKTRDGHHRSVIQRVVEKLGWYRTEGTGANLYRSGPIGRAKWGTHQLPGLLAPTSLTEHLDSYDRPFALLRMPAAGTYSIVFASEPAGASLVDAEVIDSQVAFFGAWLAQMADEPGLEAATVTIETAPDSGQRLEQEVTQHLDPNAPAYALTMMRQAVESYPAGASMVRAYVALTFTAGRPGEKKRTPEEIARNLATRMPNFTQALQATGAGAVHSVSAQELCEFVRIAYDPDSAPLIERAYAAGSTPDLTWADVGPAAHEANWQGYQHDSGYSITWQMSQAPTGIVQSQVLSKLLSPHPDILRKRITLVYKPIPSGRAAELVEKDKNAADFRVSSGNKPSARATASQRAAHATATEEAAGAGLVSFGLLATATVASPQGESVAVAAMDSLAPTARLRLRRCYGSQDSAFAACLPLGLPLEKYLQVPTQLRDQD